jgi:hypothetical protein
MRLGEWAGKKGSTVFVVIVGLINARVVDPVGHCMHQLSLISNTWNDTLTTFFTAFYTSG